MMNKRSVAFTTFVSIMLLTVLGCSGSPTKDTPDEGNAAETPTEETPSMEGQADPLPDAGAETASATGSDPTPLTDATPTPDASASPLPDASLAADGTGTPSTEPSPAPSAAVEVASTTTTTETKTETVSGEPPAAPVSTADAGSEPYTVRRGDTLMKIAFRKYGSVGKWKEIFDANKGVLQSANQLEPGTQLTLQGPFDMPKKPSGKRYTIMPGDTLAKIAEKLYGNSSKWRMLWKHNRSIIPNPNRIYAGFFLYYKHTAGAQPASTQSQPSGQSGQMSSAPGESQAAAPAAPAMTPPGPENMGSGQSAAPVPPPAAGDFGAMSQMLNNAKPN